MNKETEKNKKPEGNPAAEATQALPPLVIAAQFIKDLSFEAPDLPQVLMELKEPPLLTVNVDIKAEHLKENHFEVMLKLKVHTKNQEEKTLFVCELNYSSLVQLNVPEKEHVEPMLLVEVPRLLFPFARQIIADLTKESGLMPIILAPIDFFALFRARMEQQAQQEASNVKLN